MTSPHYFDGLYRDDLDPWDLVSSPYEQRKLALLMASLPEARYREAFEPGCAIGVTTEALAGRCDRLLAMDGAIRAVDRARRRLAGVKGKVSVREGRIPGDWPALRFDLIVISELLYYLDVEDRREVSSLVVGSLVPGGDVAAVHWRHAFREAACDGDHAHAELADRLSAASFELRVDHAEEHFRLQIYRAPGAAGPGVPV